ncbi:cytochrome P450 [Deinococcus lacus]|uniref:Cytochrome P450 n=1 Tax=Deinococcus lacus TaxID=392561 RepID=A0ABW1YC12_9DEIO
MTSSSPRLLLALQALWSAEGLRDPYPVYERLRAFAGAGGLVQVPEWGVCLALSHTAADTVLRAPQARSAEWSSSHSDGARLLQHMMLFRNGAGHRRLRGLVEKAFTPARVEEQRELVRGLLSELLGDLARRPGPVDIVAGLSGPLPGRVILRMLGLSGTDEERFLAWSDSVAALLGGAGGPELLAHIDRDARDMREYFRDLAAQLRAHPQPGLLSALAAAEDGGQRLSGDELLSNAVLLLTAGHETTSNLIPGALLALHSQPQAWDALVEQPRQPGVADELLRFVSPVQVDSRTLSAGLAVGETWLPAGRSVQLLLAAANRDPAVFAEPERLDWARPNAARHLAFAAGPHYCLGASLARLEIAEVFAALAARFPRLRVVDPAPAFNPNHVLRGLQALWVQLE